MQKRPQNKGLYKPQDAIESCGFGLIAHMEGKTSHALVYTACTALTRMTHRGAVSVDGKTGDGCGILLAFPESFFRAVAMDEGMWLHERFAVGMVFLSQDQATAERSLQILEGMGIRFILGATIGQDISFKEIVDKHDAVFLGLGTYEEISGALPGERGPGVYKALNYLIGNTRSLLDMPPGDYPYIDFSGQRVVVLGAGDTAMDCVRTAVRQGASEVHCLYRRDRKNMPGSQNEVNHAIEEGVQFHFNSQPLEILAGNDKTSGVRLVETRLGDPDESGRRRPKAVSGSERVFAADAVVIAFGFNASPENWFETHGIETDDRGLVIASEHSQFPFQTSNPKVFAAGDMVRGADLVVTAIADARKAAGGMVVKLAGRIPLLVG